jgi:predicted permease
MKLIIKYLITFILHFFSSSSRYPAVDNPKTCTMITRYLGKISLPLMLIILLMNLRSWRRKTIRKSPYDINHSTAIGNFIG